MEENKKPETTSQQDSAPVDYSHYMGTLNRIYRRNNNSKKKRLGDGITSLKQEQKSAEPARARTSMLGQCSSRAAQLVRP